MPEDEFDLDAAIQGAKNVVAENTDDFDLDSAIANVKTAGADAIAAARAKAEELLPYGEKPVVNRQFVPEDQVGRFLRPEVTEGDLPWYRQFVTEPFRKNVDAIDPNAPLVEPGAGNEFVSDVARAGAIPVASQVLPASTPLLRAAGGGLAGGVQGGLEAYEAGEDWPGIGRNALAGSALGAGFSAVGDALKGSGKATKGRANRNLAGRAIPTAELNKIRAEGGEAGVQKAGQDLRDTGLTKARSVGDYFTGVKPSRLSENSHDILNAANEQRDRAVDRIINAPTGEMTAPVNGEMSPITVGESPVDMSPVRDRLMSEAGSREYGKNPDAASVYRETAARVTTPHAATRTPAPEPNITPGTLEQLESVSPGTGPDAPVSRIPFGGPDEPGAFSRDVPASPIESNAPGSYESDNLFSMPVSPAPEAPIENFSRVPGRPNSPSLPIEPGLPETPAPGAFSRDVAPSPIESTYEPQASFDAPQSAAVPPAPAGAEFERFPTPTRPYTGGADVPPNPVNQFGDLSGGKLNMPGAIEPTSDLKDLGPKRPEPRPNIGTSPLPVGGDDFNLLERDMGNVPSRPGGPTVDRFGAPPERLASVPFSNEAWPSSEFATQSNADALADLMPRAEPGLPYAQHTTLEQTQPFTPDARPPAEVDLPSEYRVPRASAADGTLAPPEYRPPQEPYSPIGGSLDFTPDRGPSSLNLLGPFEGNATSSQLPPPRSTVIERIPQFTPSTPSQTPALDVPKEFGIPDWSQEAKSAPWNPKRGMELESLSPNKLDSFEPTSYPPTPSTSAPVNTDPQYSLNELRHTRKELGNSIANFRGRELNMRENDVNSANLDAWKGSGDAEWNALVKHMEGGSVNPADVADYRQANKTFSSVADVNKNLAGATNRDYKSPAIKGDETITGGGLKAVGALANKSLLGVNAQYGIGQGLEGLGKVADAGSQLARAGAGLGWFGKDKEHPEMAKVVSENPQAPKAVVESKTNDKMKQSLMGSWYTSLVDTAKGLFD